jgi:uncharacterized protein (UPF0332 family)
VSKKDEHILKACHNEKFYSSFDIKTTTFRDWVVTGLFYCALHYVDAYLATQGIHPKHHEGFGERNDRVEHALDLKAIWGYYRALQDDSRDARYGYGIAPMRQFSEADIVELRDRSLAPLKAKILSLLAMS